MVEVRVEWEDRLKSPPIVQVPRNLLPQGMCFLTMIVYDSDRPFPQKRHASPFVQYLCINKPASSAAADELLRLGAPIEGEKLLPYVAPECKQGVPHRIYVLVATSLSPVRFGQKLTRRDQFDVRGFLKGLSLSVIYRGYFMEDSCHAE
jgi:hypothetical protein